MATKQEMMKVYDPRKVMGLCGAVTVYTACEAFAFMAHKAGEHEQSKKIMADAPKLLEKMPEACKEVLNSSVEVPKTEMFAPGEGFKDD